MLDLAPKDAGGAADPAIERRRRRGATAYRSGLSAEDSVARHYADAGIPVARRRWRGTRGEIDLIARDGDTVVFIEVKKARSFEAAVERIGQRQVARLFASAEEFCATEPRGSLTDMRFDLALVDGTGAVRILENAFL